MDYAGTPYPALERDDPLYKVKEYTEALRAALMNPAPLLLTGPVDLDTLRVNNTYFLTNANMVAPSSPQPGRAGMLEVKTSGNYSFQRITDYTLGHKVYLRATDAGGRWSAWKSYTAT